MALLLEYYETRNENYKRKLKETTDILDKTGKNLDDNKAEVSDEDKDKYHAQSRAP